ncbi:hypothetical protein [Halomonas sp.]|uniref:hypothetical protein n=1 Tax=Halomonas sp. TaxID=1486246 RepID=UPI00298D84F6|nr:hypothetical protein [Halomonas sp.]MDW7748628.1 hypothetical protein [Halomonas sp.]
MPHTSNSLHQLPSAILSEWKYVLEKITTLSESEAALLKAGIRYALPPLSQSDARQALSYYLFDNQVTTAIQVEPLVEQLPIQTEKRRNTASSHPLYTAMVHITGTNSLNQSLYQACRRMLSEYFSDAGHDAHPTTLYEDIVNTRNALSTIAQKNLPGPVGEADDRYLIGLLNQYMTNVSSNIPANLPRNIARFQRLFRGMNSIIHDDTTARLPGAHSGNRPSQRRGKRKSKRDKDLDGEILTSLRKRDDRRKEKQSHTSSMERQDRQQQARSEGEISGLTERGPYRFEAHSKSSTDGEGADEHIETLQRTKPSTMTIDDDRRVVQHAQRMSLVDTLKSMTDIHRLTAGQLIDVLIDCRHDPAQWSLSLLLLCTGIPLERLTSLEINTDLSLEKRPDSDAPQVIMDGALLTYRLLDGPSKAVMTDNDHLWVILSLPPALSEALKKAVAEHGNRPLRGATKKLRLRLTRNARDISGNPGLPATIARLGASSWMLIRPLAQDDVAAKALSGRFGISLAAPAAYRTLAPGELNDIFQKALECLLPSLISSPYPDWLEGSHYDWITTPYMCADSWQTGSHRAVPVTAFSAWFGWLRQGMREATRRFMSPSNPREPSPESLLDIVATSAAHGYLVMLLTTGCRPHGRHVRCERVEEHLWLADKDSPKAQESRWIPAAKELLTCLDEHRRLVADATDWLTRRGYEVKDRRSPGEYSLFAEINWTHQATMAVIPISHKPFIKWMSNLQPNRNVEGLIPDDAVRNITRHSVATYCRGLLPDAQLAAMLGHVNGFRQAGPSSSAISPARGPWQTIISDLLKDAGYQVLKRNSLQHALRY